MKSTDASNEYKDELQEKDGKIPGAAEFPPGTRVYVKAPLLNEHYKKLRERWRGVFIVVKEFDTACLVTPLRQDVKVEPHQLPQDLPHGVIPPPRVRRVDKSELKKCRSLTFFSRPLARDFTRDFLQPYESANEFYTHCSESALDQLCDEEKFSTLVEHELGEAQGK